jgi:hypothetical protein
VPEHDDAPFPPLWLTRLFAYGLSIIMMPVLYGLWYGEREAADPELYERFQVAGWLLLAALVPSWLAYIWTSQGHFNHATVAFVLASALLAASLFFVFG